MITSILLSVIAAAFAVASLLLLLLLIDVLVRRADVTAALLIGSTLMDAFFAGAVPSLTFPGDIGWDRPISSRPSSVCCVRKTLRMRRLVPTIGGWSSSWSSRAIVSERNSCFRGPDQRSDFRLMEFWIGGSLFCHSSAIPSDL